MTNVGYYLGNVNVSVMFIFTCDSEKTKILKKLKKQQITEIGPLIYCSSRSSALLLELMRLPTILNLTYSNIFLDLHVMF